MDGWQADARLRVAQLLCWLILCAEEGATQHAQTIVKAMLRGAGDEDNRVILEVYFKVAKLNCANPCGDGPTRIHHMVS